MARTVPANVAREANPTAIDAPHALGDSTRGTLGFSQRGDRPRRFSDGHAPEFITSTLGDSATTSLDALQQALRSFSEQRRITLGEEAIRKQEFQDYFLGCAYVRFAGLRTISQVVKLSNNPNDRQNPREKSLLHVEELAQSIDHGKYDWQYPLILFVDPDLLSNEMKDTLKKTIPFQPWSEPELLSLNNISQAELRLDEEIFFERSMLGLADSFLTDDQLAAKRAEYSELQSKRKLATLGNGNHRIAAMTLRAEEIIGPLRKEVISLQKRRFIGEDYSVDDLLKQKASELKSALNDLTWQVLIFRDDSPAELKSQLIRNDPVKPNMAASSGEEVWMFAEKVDRLYARIKGEYPGENRPEIMDRVHYHLQAEKKAMGTIDGDEESSTNTSNNKTAKAGGRSRMLGGADGKEVWHRIPTEPCLLEMMLATRACLQAWTKTVTNPQITAMLRDAGAVLAAKFWLSLELLQMIANITDKFPLKATEDFVHANPKLSIGGLKESVRLWHSVQANPNKIPLGLRLFDDAAAKLFLTIYQEEFPTRKESDGLAIERNWEDPKNVVKMRKVFDLWGSKLGQQNLHHDGFRRICAAARLYARLPLWKLKVDASGSEPLDSTACFFPRAVLPCTEIIKQWTRMNEPLNGGAGIEVLEFLLDRHKHMWTMASGDAGTRCKANWYLSGRGPHHVLLSFFLAENLGSTPARLTEALKLLDSLHFRNALLYVDAAVAPEHRVKAMRTAYGANKSQGLQVDPVVFRHRKHRLAETGLPDIEEVLKKMVRGAQQDILRYIEKGDPSEQELTELIERHPCLKFISDDFWSTAPIIWWGSGWGNTIQQRRLYTAGVILGWGMLQDAYEELVTNQVLVHRRSWFLVRVAARVSELDRITPWWDEIYSVSALKQYRARLLDIPPTDTDSLEESESDPDDTTFSKVKPLTGLHEPRLHVTPSPHEPLATIEAGSGANSLASPRSDVQRDHSGASSPLGGRQTPPGPPVTTDKRRGPQNHPKVPRGKGSQSGGTELNSGTSSQVETQEGTISLTNREKRRAGPSIRTRDSAPSAATSGSRTPTWSASSVARKRPSRAGTTKTQATRAGGSSDDEETGLGTPARTGVYAKKQATRAGESSDESGSPKGSAKGNGSKSRRANENSEDEGKRAHCPVAGTTRERPSGANDEHELLVNVDILWPPGVVTPASDSSSHYSMLATTIPPPFFVIGPLSPKTLASFDGQIVAHRVKTQDPKKLKWIQLSHDAMSFTLAALEVVSKLRKSLRNQICSTIATVFSSGSAAHTITDNLAPQLYMLKVTHIKRVATELKHFGMSLDEALTEASFMAGTDGLLASDSYVWDGESGIISALLHNTLPLQAQQMIPEAETMIPIGRVISEDRELLGAMLPYALPVVGQGSTQGLCLALGATNGIVRGHLAQTSDQNVVPLIDSDHPFIDSPPNFDQSRVFRTLGLDGECVTGSAACGYSQTREDFPATKQAPRSCFSTGVFIRPSPRVPTFRKFDDSAEEMELALSYAETKLAEKWGQYTEDSVRHLKAVKRFYADSFHSFESTDDFEEDVDWFDALQSSAAASSRRSRSHSRLRDVPGPLDVPEPIVPEEVGPQVVTQTSPGSSRRNPEVPASSQTQSGTNTSPKQRMHPYILLPPTSRPSSTRLRTVNSESEGVGSPHRSATAGSHGSSGHSEAKKRKKAQLGKDRAGAETKRFRRGSPLGDDGSSLEFNHGDTVISDLERPSRCAMSANDAPKPVRLKLDCVYLTRRAANHPSPAVRRAFATQPSPSPSSNEDLDAAQSPSPPSNEDLDAAQPPSTPSSSELGRRVMSYYRQGVRPPTTSSIDLGETKPNPARCRENLDGCRREDLGRSEAARQMMLTSVGVDGHVIEVPDCQMSVVFINLVSDEEMSQAAEPTCRTVDGAISDAISHSFGPEKDGARMANKISDDIAECTDKQRRVKSWRRAVFEANTTDGN